MTCVFYMVCISVRRWHVHPATPPPVLHQCCMRYCARAALHLLVCQLVDIAMSNFPDPPCAHITASDARGCDTHKSTPWLSFCSFVCLLIGCKQVFQCNRQLPYWGMGANGSICAIKRFPTPKFEDGNSYAQSIFPRLRSHHHVITAMRLLLAALLVAAACSQLGQAARLTPENSAELLTDAPSGLSYTLPKNATYKNVKPLIGILTQPCTECPGASECTPAFHQVRVTCRPKRAACLLRVAQARITSPLPLPSGWSWPEGGLCPSGALQKLPSMHSSLGVPHALHSCSDACSHVGSMHPMRSSTACSSL